LKVNIGDVLINTKRRYLVGLRGTEGGWWEEGQKCLVTAIEGRRIWLRGVTDIELIGLSDSKTKITRADMDVFAELYNWEIL